ncbi:hypothetical protein OF001_U280044 [Pseudomonas sp. OF001]|nr:hypothetical protein OF001_U280044 [Pseudomonas sp. OF001]
MRALLRPSVSLGLLSYLGEYDGHSPHASGVPHSD